MMAQIQPDHLKNRVSSPEFATDGLEDPFWGTIPKHLIIYMIMVITTT